MKKAALVLVLLLLFISSDFSQSQNEALKTAKTLYISTPEGSSLDLRAEIAKKIIKWGKLQIVTSEDKADLVLKVEQTRGFSAWKGKGARGAAILSDRRSGVELWTTSEGGDWSMAGYSIGRVGRKIAEKLIKFYERQLR